MGKNFGGFNTVLIVGLGLIGGSLAKALKKAGYKGKIFAYDLSKDRINYAKENKIIDEGFTDLKEIPWKEIDLIVLATPVKTFEGLAKEIKKYINYKTVITDVGSVKGEIVKNLEEIFKPNEFIGAHPIAGTEKEGVENALEDLFKNKKVIITIDEETENSKRVEELWNDIGAKVEIMDPYLHDFIFASVSHLPHAVAFALVDSLINLSKEAGVDLFLYPGGGFKDFTRIAASSPTIWKDIFIENKSAVLHTIDEFMKSMGKLKELIKKEDEKELINMLSESREKRLSLED